MGSDAIIRPARPDDAPALAELAGKLGYPTTREQMQQRLQLVSRTPTHAVFVAESQALLGWIHVAAVLSLESGVFAEITGLIVDESTRGSGIGRQLVTEAERWGAAHACTEIRVRTNVVREGARKFYRQIGYRVLKTQEVFAKDVSG